MPIGSNINATAQAPGVNGVASAALNLTAGNTSNRASQYANMNSGSVNWAPWVLVGLAAIYLFYSVILQHQRLQEGLRPANVAANFHNFIVVGVQAAIFLVLAKIALTKAVAWGLGFLSPVAQFFQAA